MSFLTPRKALAFGVSLACLASVCVASNANAFSRSGGTMGGMGRMNGGFGSVGHFGPRMTPPYGSFYPESPYYSRKVRFGGQEWVRDNVHPSIKGESWQTDFGTICTEWKVWTWKGYGHYKSQVRCRPA